MNVSARPVVTRALVHHPGAGLCVLPRPSRSYTPEQTAWIHRQAALWAAPAGARERHWLRAHRDLPACFRYLARPARLPRAA